MWMKKVHKEYSNWKDIDSCENINPSNNGKKCLFIGNESKEVYEGCESYDDSNEEIIKSIIPDNVTKKVLLKEGNVKKRIKNVMNIKQAKILLIFVKIFIYKIKKVNIVFSLTMNVKSNMRNVIILLEVRLKYANLLLQKIIINANWIIMVIVKKKNIHALIYHKY